MTTNSMNWSLSWSRFARSHGTNRRGALGSWRYATPVTVILAHSGGVIADRGYQGCGYVTPRKKPKGGELCVGDKESNKHISGLRAPIERAIAHIKSWRILHTDYRRPLSTYRTTFLATIGLFFFKVAIGNAPTALRELIRLGAAGAVRPALVIGLPVGFVDAAAAKAALRDSGLSALSNRSAKGGAAVAGAAVNALLYLERAR